jgi:hypothetical protein
MKQIQWKSSIVPHLNSLCGLHFYIAASQTLFKASFPGVMHHLSPFITYSMSWNSAKAAGATAVGGDSVELIASATNSTDWSMLSPPKRLTKLAFAYT